MTDGAYHHGAGRPGFNGESAPGSGKPWNWMLFPFSSVKADVEAVYAASVGHGVFEIDPSGGWSKLEGGLEDQMSVNRLQLYYGTLSACASTGLYEYSGGRWENAGLAIPCFQHRMLGRTGYAGTEYGLWCRAGAKWEQIALHEKRVYDFINLPQYIVVGRTGGFSIYDRYMDDWAEFELERDVTSLTVYRGRIVGASDKGELLLGDTRGRFERVRFGKMFVFSVCAYGRNVFVCSDRGLFRMANIRNQATLLPVKLGFPVTDVDQMDGALYMATLFQGVHRMDL